MTNKKYYFNEIGKKKKAIWKANILALNKSGFSYLMWCFITSLKKKKKNRQAFRISMFFSH